MRTLLLCLAALALTVYFEPARITISGNEAIPVIRVEASPAQVGRNGGTGGSGVAYVTTSGTTGPVALTLSGSTSGTLIPTSNSAAPMLTR